MIRTTVAVAAAAAAAFLAPTAAAAAPQADRSYGAPSGASCRIPLTYGNLVITRTTGYVGNGRYWTSIRLESTGDEVKLVYNRGIGYGSRGTMIRLGRGITGHVNTARSWGLHSRTPNMVATVGVVDTVTGLPGSASC